jgi:hypothetical protein
MPSIDLRAVLQETLSSPYGDLVTRRTGEAVRSSVEVALGELDGGQAALIDFTSVRCLDLSCADEIVAKLLVAYGGARPFLLLGVSEAQREAIEPVLDRRDLAVAAQDRTGRLHVLGSASDVVQRVFTLLADRGAAEAHEVAQQLAVPLAAAREAIDELLERRLALARGTGAQMIPLA